MATMTPIADNPFTEIVFRSFRVAGGTAADYELRVRLLADKTPALAKWATAKNLQDVEIPLTAHFSASLTEDEKKLLATVRVLRNKLLHGEFTTARTKLEELGHPKQTAKINVVKLPDPLHLEGFHAAVQAAEPFAVDSAPDGGNLFAWVLQLAADGSFDAAAKAFQRGLDVINRLSLL